MNSPNLSWIIKCLFLRDMEPLICHCYFMKGFQHVSPIENFPVDVWRSMVNLHLTVPFLLVRYFLPYMKEKGIDIVCHFLGFSDTICYLC